MPSPAMGVSTKTKGGMLDFLNGRVQQEGADTRVQPDCHLPNGSQSRAAWPWRYPRAVRGWSVEELHQRIHLLTAGTA